MGPLVAPGGTVARTTESEFTINCALVPLKATAVTPLRAIPLTRTVVPITPFAGVKPAIADAGVAVPLTEID
jgi:hypothetical protein